MISKESLTKRHKILILTYFVKYGSVVFQRKTMACYKEHILVASWTIQTCHAIYLTSVLVVSLFHSIIVLNPYLLICYLFSVELWWDSQ